MYMIIGACALAVIIGLVLLLTLQSSCGEQEIPVVEQGDGDELISVVPDGEVTSMGDIVVDDGGAPVTEFEVMVMDADGIYRRTVQDGSEYALTITGQNAESFSFGLELAGVTVDGVAYFNGETTAVCEKADGVISFAFDADAVNVVADETIGTRCEKIVAALC